jgi:hypothetical protein
VAVWAAAEAEVAQFRQRTERLITDKCRCGCYAALPFGTCLRSLAGPLTRSGSVAPARRHSYLVISQ